MERENVSPLTAVTVSKSIVYKKILFCIILKNSVFNPVVWKYLWQFTP